jgi:hypothetical protein
MEEGEGVLTDKSGKVLYEGQWLKGVVWRCGDDEEGLAVRL